jgi:hypothetical protein
MRGTREWRRLLGPWTGALVVVVVLFVALATEQNWLFGVGVVIALALILAWALWRAWQAWRR